MTREEMIEKANVIRKQGAFAPVTPQELSAFAVTQTELAVKVESGRTVHVFSLAPEEGLAPCAPMIINFHGGGFIKGRADRDRLYCSRFARNMNCLVWDIDYCLAPEAPFPAAVEECSSVVQYVFAHTEQLGVDAARILLVGHSAGGNLVAAVCQKMTGKESLRPCALLLEYYPADMKRDPIECLRLEQLEDERAVTRAKTERLYSLLYAEPDQQNDPLVSPLLAEDKLLASFAPSLIISAGQDSLCQETEAFARRLLEAGVPVAMRRFVNSPHGFTINRTGEWQQAITLHESFIRAYFEGKPKEEHL